MTIERLKEKGAIGYPCFLLRKMVMTFNDGAFGWGREGNITLNSYPVLSDASYADTLKNIFWPNHKYSEYFNTYSQIIWFVILLVGTVGIARYYSLLETGLKKLISHMKQKQKR